MSRFLCRGVAKLVKASDFDSDMRGFESFLPCQSVARRLWSLQRRCTSDGRRSKPVSAGFAASARRASLNITA